MRLIRPASLFAFLLVALLLAGCGEKPAYKQQSYVFGTLVEISIQGEDEDKAKRVAAQVLKDFDELHRTLHAWEPGTLERINGILAHAEPGKPARAALPPGLIPIIEDATRFAVQSEHLFNPAIGNLVRLWGFHADNYEPDIPPGGEIERLVQARPRMTDIRIDGLMFEGGNPAVRIDLGGYAKGYALDLAAAYLRGQGVKNALVNIGGNIMALGRHGDRPWRVGIQHPRRAGAIATLDLRDGEAIGTSGDYQRYFLVDETRYCHLIDPRTGWPVQGVQAVTVLTRGDKAGVLSDVASKPLFIAGAAGWRDMARRMGIGQALFIAGDGRVRVTAPLASRLNWEDNGATPTVVP
ncbi:MAG TPA: FAD:protein FMN transferase [Thiobacillaceae bacterium]|nr:FAD:protein FMN transferase [Thiobacillaceae bacterium]